MSRRRRRARRRQTDVGVKIAFAGFSFLGILLIAVAISGMWVWSVASKAPDVLTLKEIDKGQNSVIFAGDGTRLGMIESDQVRRPIPYTDMPAHLKNATVAVEDQRFFSHSGVDIEGGLRALVKNLETGEITEGASTITMQLMRNVFIANPKRDYERKIIEAKMALDYEKEHSKQEILKKYLNTAPYGTNQGRTAIGADAAARVYFSVAPSELSLPQAALLAGLPQAPSDYNPIQNPAGAKRRRDEVLDAMAESGMIPVSRAETAKSSGLQLDPSGSLFERREPFFLDYVESELIAQYGFNTVRRGGLRVFTTIEPTMQQAGLDAISDVLDEGGPSGALVAIDPTSGEVKAMVSSQAYSENQYNLAAQGKRQPGSTFKTFTLAAAIDQGMNPDTTFYESKPLSLDDPVYGPWEVATYGDTYAGTTSVADATLSSDNSVYAQMALDLGPEKVAEMAKKLGVETELDGYPAETLGGLRIGVSPLEMATAYATLAAGGVHRDPVVIEKVVFPDGEEERPGTVDPERVLSEAEAFEVTKILARNITEGTGTGAYTGCVGQAGKTGTTDNFVDAWFIGYQPNLATATWVGYPESNDISMPGVAGGTLPASIWNGFFTNAEVSCEEFSEPEEAIEWSDSGFGYSVSGETSDLAIVEPGDSSDEYVDTGQLPEPDPVETQGTDTSQTEGLEATGGISP
mgnify:CR=1 FL=1